MDDRQRREFHEALLDAGTFEDLPGKWQAAIMEAEQKPAEASRPCPATLRSAAEQEIAQG